MEEDRRLGFVGIVVERRDEIREVNRILTQYAPIIRGRNGVPNQEDQSAVIGLIVEGTNDQLGAMTGKLGNVPGITVRSALASRRKKEGSRNEPESEKENEP